MKESDILSTLKEQVRAELGREANEVTEKLVHAFRSELGKCKTSLIAEMLRKIEIIAGQDDTKQQVVFQINIKAGGDKDDK